MPTLSPFQVRLFAPDNTAWRVLSGRKNAAGTVASATWRITREEGYADGSVNINGRRSDVSGLALNRRIEFWGRNEDGTYTRLYRGYVGRIQQRRSGTRQTIVTLYGISTRVGKQRTNQLYRYVSGKDIGEAFSEIASKWAAAKFPDVVFQGGLVGQSVDSFDGRDKTVSQATSELLELTGGFAVGGGDVEPGGLRDRIGIRSFDAKPPASPPALTIKLPDARATISEPSPDEDMRRLANILYLKGGADRYPNLLADAVQGNTGFEVPIFGTGDGSDLTINNRLSDPGFEQRSGVNVLSGGASFKVGGLEEGPTDGGDDMVKLDDEGEKVAQTVTGSLVAGHTYVFNTRARLSVGGLGGQELTCRIIWLFPGGGGEAVNEVAFSEFSSLPLNDAIWRTYPITAVCPDGASGVRVENENTANSDDGILIDNRSFFDSSTLYQQGWEVRPLSDARITQLNLAYDADASPLGQSAYSILFGGTVPTANTDNHDINLRPQGAAKATVQPNQSVRLSVWLKSPPGQTSCPVFQLQMFTYTQGGEYLSNSRATFAPGAALATWTRYDLTKTVEATAATVLCIPVSLRSTGVLLVDNVSLRDSASDPETWLENEQYTITLRSDTPALAATSEILASIEDNGEMPEEVTVEAITGIADAEAYAKAFFTARATPINKPSVKIVGRSLPLWPGQWVGCVGTDAPDLFTMSETGALPIAEIAGAFDGGLISQTLYLSQERESETRTARTIARQEARLRTGQSGANGSTGASGGSGGSVPGTGGAPTDSAGGAIAVTGPDAADPTATLSAANVSTVNFSGSVQLTKDGTGKIVGVEVLATGEPGSDGSPGSIWYAGNGVPGSGLGLNGDLYLNTNATTGTGDVYRKAAGAWSLTANIRGAMGSQGDPGDDGDDGEDGADGEPGSVIYYGTGVPAGGIGINGDYYIRTATGAGKGDLYTKTSGAWSVILNIVGPAGQDGEDGADGTGSGNPIYADGAPYSSLPSTPVDVFQFDSTLTVTDMGASGTTANKRKVKIGVKAKKSWTGYVDLSVRLVIDNSTGSAIPSGMGVGDWQIMAGDFTGTSRDPYTAPTTSAGIAPMAANMSVSPIVINGTGTGGYTGARAGIYSLNIEAITATVLSGVRSGTVVKVHKPLGTSGAVGGKALVEVSPQSSASYGTYIFRMYYIKSVDTSTGSYLMDIYELGFTLGDTLTDYWGANPPDFSTSSGQFGPGGTYTGGPGGITAYIYRAFRRDVISYSTGTTALTATLPTPTDKSREEILVLLSPGSGNITINLPSAGQYYNSSTGLLCDIIFVRSGSGTGTITINVASGESMLNGSTAVALNSTNQSLTFEPYNTASWILK